MTDWLAIGFALGWTAGIVSSHIINRAQARRIEAEVAALRRLLGDVRQKRSTLQ